jgi:hypothetical protein
MQQDWEGSDGQGKYSALKFVYIFGLIPQKETVGLNIFRT